MTENWPERHLGVGLDAQSHLHLSTPESATSTAGSLPSESGSVRCLAPNKILFEYSVNTIINLLFR